MLEREFSIATRQEWEEVWNFFANSLFFKLVYTFFWFVSNQVKMSSDPEIGTDANALVEPPLHKNPMQDAGIFSRMTFQYAA